MLKKAASKGAMPSGPEQLRLRLTVMQNALLMIGLQHPRGEKYKDYLLGDYCYGLRSNETSGSLAPPWTLVLSYENAIRKHAYKADGAQRDRLRRRASPVLETWLLGTPVHHTALPLC